MLGLNDVHQAFVNRLKTGLRIRLFFAAAIRSQWFRSPAEIYEAAEVGRVGRRRAELELGKLVRQGWLDRHEKGAANQERLVRYEPGAAAIKLIGAVRSIRSERSDQNDRSESPPPTRRTQARDHAQQKETLLSLDPRSMDNTVRPSGGVQGGESATDGRTEVEQGDLEKRLQSAIAWVQERQGIAPEMSTAGLTRLLNAGASDHELRAYVIEVQRGTHSCLDGLETARFRFGSACTAKRFAIWRASRVRRARGPSVREQVERELERELDPTAMPAPDEMTAIAELVKARMK